MCLTDASFGQFKLNNNGSDILIASVNCTCKLMWVFKTFELNQIYEMKINF